MTELSSSTIASSGAAMPSETIWGGADMVGMDPSGIDLPTRAPNPPSVPTTTPIATAPASISPSPQDTNNQMDQSISPLGPSIDSSLGASFASTNTSIGSPPQTSSQPAPLSATVSSEPSRTEN